MNKAVFTDDAPAPFSAYSQAVQIEAGSRLVHVSGQVGAAADGSLSGDEREQHEQCWRNILAILGAAGLGADDIVDVTGYLTSPAGVPIYRDVRDRMLDGARPASTVVIVAGLAGPQWKVEISVVAAAHSHREPNSAAVDV